MGSENMKGSAITIIVAGRYEYPMPADLVSALEQSIAAHMKAYGIQQVSVVTREEDSKRAYAKELFEALESLLENGLDECELAYLISQDDVKKARTAIAKARGESAALQSPGPQQAR